MPEDLEKRIIDEIRGKAEDFEDNRSDWLAEQAEFGDLFKVRAPKRSRTQHEFSNPRVAEFFRASNALATLMFRMMTVEEPFFSPIPMDIRLDPMQLRVIQDVIGTQLEVSDYEKHLLKSLMYVVPFGTVVCQEDYKLTSVNQFRQIPVTDFRPRMLDQVGFERNAMDIEEADWIFTADLCHKNELLRLAGEKSLGKEWSKEALEEAANDVETEATINKHVFNRMERAAFRRDEILTTRKELLFYYGRLDAMNDSTEYVVALVNRKHMVRFHANNFQHGRRQFRIGKWVDFDEPTGLGLGHLLGNQHRSLDRNRQRLQDFLAMGTYNMWSRLRTAGISDDDLKIRPLQIVDMDERNGLEPLKMDFAGAEAGLRLEEILKQEFRSASGATDTLQAIITEGTATEVSLAQNEAMRNVSTKAKLLAKKLVKEHLETMHFNNVQNIKKPFNINSAGIARQVYPADLRYDVDFKLKMATDKDFRPQRMDQLIQALQIITSTKSDHPQLAQAPVVPLLKHILHNLGVPTDTIPDTPPAPQQLGAMDMMGMAPGTVPPMDMMEPTGGELVVPTPVGDTLASPE